MKALYGGSIQTSGWTHASSEGITGLRWATGTSDAPTSVEIGETLTGAGAATGELLAVDGYRHIAWVRNTSVGQFVDGENVTSVSI